MMNFISKNSLVSRLVIFAVWIAIWQFLAYIVSQELLLPSPVKIFLCFLRLSREPVFWFSIFNSLLRIIIGFLMAVFIGTALACICSFNRLANVFFAPLLGILKATPVASFTIIALVWIKSANLSTFVAFIMVLPLIYSNVLQGIASVDIKLLEMAQVFRIGLVKRVSYIYFNSIKPYFVSALAVSFGIAWKSGISAEVIGLPRNTIGINLYNSKIYLETDSLFAWTIVIIVLSAVMERWVIKIINYRYRGNT